MDANVDKRVQRTKALIREALVSLIEDKGFDALTVRDIATRAKINRGTFYLHYRDKFDLLDQTLAELIAGVQEILLGIARLPAAEVAGGQGLLTAATKLFAYFQSNARLMRAILATKGSQAFQDQVKQAMWHNIFEKKLITLIKRENLLVPPEYLISYLAGAHAGLLREWLERGCPEAPEEMARILIHLSLRGPMAAAGLAAPGLAAGHDKPP
ncbi:MAG TPA: TetR/AcrR family transcriptional regulator [Clostridia bacterium]|nr:TetR/AcrR family transcriptional regulator [Clostridia bacterium]